MSLSWYPWVIACASALAALAIGFLLLLALRWQAQQRIADRVLGPGEGMREEWQRAGRMLVTALIARLGHFLDRRLDPKGENLRLLLQSGWRGARARGIWYWTRGALPLLATLLVPLLHLVLERDAWLWSAAVLIVAMLAPPRLLRLHARRRIERIRGEVPLFIHLLVLLFEAGLSTPQALSSIARDGRKVLRELGQECELAVRQIEAGAQTSEALDALGRGLAVPELTGILNVLRQVDRYGGEVRAPLLDALAVLEERRSLALREKVNELSGRMTVAMVLFFFPALMIFVAGPAFVSILRALGQAAAS